MEEEEIRESPGSSCLSMKSDWSKEIPPHFSQEPEPSDTKGGQHRARAQSPGTGCLSMKSDWSKEIPPHFSKEPEPSETKEKKRDEVCVAEKLSRCSLCHDVLKSSFSHNCGHCGADAGLQDLLDKHKRSLRTTCELVTEGGDKAGGETFLNKIYTELYITEGPSEEVESQHEVTQLERENIKSLQDTPIRCQDIFKAFPEETRHIRVVLMNGVAGVGKTFSVHKFTLDWAEGLENQDVDVVILLSFRELNLIREKQYSLLMLLQVFYPTLHELTADQLHFCKLLFIFDGLDEGRLPLDFDDREVVCDVTQKSSVNTVVINLIQGNLVPSALIWITSRPAASNQVPGACVDRVTEVRGFTDSQKVEYFRRRFSDEELSNRILSHIQTSKSLHIMCGIPVFCWLTATVLEHMLTAEQSGELPKTLTDMYSHFVLVQIRKKKQKYTEGNPHELMKADGEFLLNLGRLAFEHLEKGNIMFYQDDLEQVGLDLIEVLVNSGVCTQIFRRELGIFQKPVYCFVHLSIQEFLAAVYMFHCFTNKVKEVMEGFLGKGCSFLPLELLLNSSMQISMKSKNSHLDLFVRFLHGLILESNQRLLGGLLGWKENSADTRERVLQGLKHMNTYDMCPEKSINIFHCLMEMNDLSVHQDIQEFLKSEKGSEKELTEVHCSALAYMLQMSEEVLDELDLGKYYTTDEGRLRLIPAVRNCRKARLSRCGLREAHCEILVSALKSNPSYLTELDLSRSHKSDTTMKLLCAGLESPNCRLEALSLRTCFLQEVGLASLVSALKLNPFYMKHLDLSLNYIKDSGVKQLCDFLNSPHCRLETLGLNRCSVSVVGCGYLVSALKSNPSHLKCLMLSSNQHFGHAGVKELCGFLESPDCRLEILGLSHCSVSVDGCRYLVSALMSNPFHLKCLQLSSNPYIADLGVQVLCGFLKSPDCRLESLELSSCRLSGISCSSLATVLKSTPSHLKQLNLTDNPLEEGALTPLIELVEGPECGLETLHVGNTVKILPFQTISQSLMQTVPDLM